MNRRLTACLALACFILLALASVALGAPGRPHAVANPSTARAACHGCRGTFAAPTVGEALSTTNGTWTNSPTSFTYHWQDGNSSGLSCANVTGAMSQSYTIVTADVAHTIVVVVTAANSARSASNASIASGLVTAAVPGNTALPALSFNNAQLAVKTAAGLSQLVTPSTGEPFLIRGTTVWASTTGSPTTRTGAYPSGSTRPSPPR
jgi:hypothetical protein